MHGLLSLFCALLLALPASATQRKARKKRPPKPRQVERPIPEPRAPVSPLTDEIQPPAEFPPTLERDRSGEPWPIRLMMGDIKGGMLVRIPVIDTDPNRGITYGVMPIWVYKENGGNRIRTIHAPSLTYNRIFKLIPTYRYYLYPDDLSALNFRASISFKDDKELLGAFEDVDFLDRGWALGWKAQFNVDGSERFFGMGPDSVRAKEANYTSHTIQHFIRLGLPIFKGSGWKFNLSHHIAGVRLTDGPVDALPDLKLDFPTHAPQHYHQDAEMQLFMDYDTRDSAVTTTRGAYSKIFVENAQRELGSEFSFQRYGFEQKHFMPHGADSRFVTGVHARYEQLVGNAPFYLQPSLGGKYIHRAYGTGRYIDRGLAVMNIEERITVWKIPVAGVVTEYEFAPFMGLGTVFDTPGRMASRYARPVYGASVRAIARPQVVGSIDFGVGQEGLAVFMDINYPF
ncbi:MAG: BamA/TamA family outer membrane protein [Elusimicrobiota bacterium]|jgi:hypothetical protein